MSFFNSLFCSPTGSGRRPRFDRSSVFLVGPLCEAADPESSHGSRLCPFSSSLAALTRSHRFLYRRKKTKKHLSKTQSSATARRSRRSTRASSRSATWPRPRSRSTSARSSTSGSRACRAAWPSSRCVRFLFFHSIRFGFSVFGFSPSPPISLFPRLVARQHPHVLLDPESRFR